MKDRLLQKTADRPAGYRAADIGGCRYSLVRAARLYPIRSGHRINRVEDSNWPLTTSHPPGVAMTRATLVSCRPAHRLKIWPVHRLIGLHEMPLQLDQHPLLIRRRCGVELEHPGGDALRRAGAGTHQIID